MVYFTTALAACIGYGDNTKNALEDDSKKWLNRRIEIQAAGSAEHSAKTMKDEQMEDVSKWIFEREIA